MHFEPLLTSMSREDPEGTRATIRRALYDQAGDVVAAAKKLGVTRLTLYRCMQRLGMKREAARYRRKGQMRFRLPLTKTTRHNEDGGRPCTRSTS